MGIIFLLFIAILTIPAFGAYFVSRTVRLRLQKQERKNAKMISVITYIACFVVIVAAILFASSFIRLER
jgi:hypothetical protein